MTPPTNTGATRAPALDGVRAVAVLAVLLFHQGFDWATGGFLGVSTFFTLSGYLITSLLFAAESSSGGTPVALSAFWSRRGRRLLPAGLAGVVLAVVTTAATGGPDQLRNLPGDATAAILSVANWRFALAGTSYGDLFSAPSALLHYWSLAIEAQFYLVFPLVMAGLARRRVPPRWRGVGFALAAAASAWAFAAAWAPTETTPSIYYGSHARAAELLVGAALASFAPLRPRVARAALGRRDAVITDLVAIGGLIVLGIGVHGLRLSDDLLPQTVAANAIATAGLVWALTRGAPFVGSVLSAAPLRVLGEVSYGLYVYHWPIFLWLDDDRTGLDGWALFAVRTAVVLPLALGSYHFLERPIRRAHPSGRPLLLAAGATAIAISAAAVVISSDAPPSLLAGEPAQDTAPALGDTPGATVDLGPPPDTPAFDGTWITSNHRPRLLIVGDSVATTLGKGIAAWAKTDGRPVVWPTWRYSCGIPRGGEVRLSNGDFPANPKCDRWPTVWSEMLDTFDPDVVVMLTGVWDLTDRRLPEWDDFIGIGDPAYDRYLLDEYAAAAELLSSRGARVVWLTPPCVGDKSLDGPLDDLPAFGDARMKVLRERVLPQFATENPEVVVVDLFAKVCPTGAFQKAYGDVVDARPDGLHFSDAGGIEVSKWLGPLLLSGPTIESTLQFSLADSSASAAPPGD